ncbi:hypothetical protein [Halocalculus aciditolerans]|uniref:DUF7979 domain-containing protein n=1 Tax=Halocalculus aciditolerans TaxID=1383812 RepID=A0A830F1C5_9EURY|nr:hypothetical protein [Halocalculus aciditolerans]GGL52898.1 hypothetical protein GCM10009039_08890 [Halocalculus aciditolerans]
MVTWQQTVVLFVGVVVAMAGVVLFVGVADADYKFAIDSTADHAPPGNLHYEQYENMRPEKQAIFDRAVSGETVRFEDDTPMPEVVVKNGTYYTAEPPRYFDWSNPRTFGPVLVFLAGAGIALKPVRDDMRR